MSDEPQDAEKKIIVDEDWKSRVESEREVLREQTESASPPEAESPGRPEGPSEHGGTLPPPSLAWLASSLYLQGIISLGLLPNPSTDKPEVDLSQARHAIDTVQMLYDKTQGNRTPEETEEFDRILHELRLSFVTVQQQGKQTSG